LHNAQVRAALGLSQVDEALYLQRQQELQRDFQIRQMLLQEQLDQQNRLDTILHEQQLKAIGEHLQEYPDLQQHYSRLLLSEQLQRHEERHLFRERAQIQQQEELRRRHVLQNQAASQQVQPNQAKPANAPPASHSMLRDIAADSLAGNAVKRSELEKRVYAKPDEAVEPVAKKRPRSGTHEDADLERKPKASKKKTRSPKKQESPSPVAIDEPKSPEPKEDESESQRRPSAPLAQALLDFATSKPEIMIPLCETPPSRPCEELSPPKPTLGDLLAAANAETKSDEAATALVGISHHVEWSDSEREDESARERRIALKKGDTIQLPGFTSILPQLPEEPEAAMPSKKKKKKFKSLLDDDSVDTKPNGKKKSDKKLEDAADAKAAELNVVEYPYPIDTWWPSVTSVRRERKAVGEPQDEDAFDSNPDFLSPDSPFRANVDKIKDSFANEVTPGVLEKIPHCKIHRMLMKKRKNPSAPELVYCFQVTELYPNDVVVCCTHCGTWRHTACGGHHKPFSIRESIDAPFVAVCDRCHEEEKILRDYPLARKRIDRQRSEQVRRGLSTSAAMRQASFSKHGGTYKWPLGSVSATHIGGHTRSVHSRHDKAEKQWTDMATRLGRGYGYRPKERVKVRTKELERLLVSVEDAGKDSVLDSDCLCLAKSSSSIFLFLQRVIPIDTI
jgi:hypothetical protein